MTTKISPYYQHPRYKINLETSSHKDILSNDDTIKQSDKNVIVSSSHKDILSNDDTIKQSHKNVIVSSSKSKIPLWQIVLWIGLAILISIFLLIVVVVPIAVSANQGNATSTTVSTICPTTSITTTVTLSSLPDQCTDYMTITDDTRSPDYNGTTFCDDTLFNSTPVWVRFTGSSGTLMANCPIDPYLCAADAPGWYSGVYPSSAGTITSGFACFNFFSDYCYWNLLILLTNCNGFYVYYLKAPPACNLRYCTI